MNVAKFTAVCAAPFVNTGVICLARAT